MNLRLRTIKIICRTIIIYGSITDPLSSFAEFPFDILKPNEVKILNLQRGDGTKIQLNAEKDFLTGKVSLSIETKRGLCFKYVIDKESHQTKSEVDFIYPLNCNNAPLSIKTTGNDLLVLAGELDALFDVKESELFDLSVVKSKSGINTPLKWIRIFQSEKSWYESKGYLVDGDNYYEYRKNLELIRKCPIEHFIEILEMHPKQKIKYEGILKNFTSNDESKKGKGIFDLFNYIWENESDLFNDTMKLVFASGLQNAKCPNINSAFQVVDKYSTVLSKHYKNHIKVAGLKFENSEEPMRQNYPNLSCASPMSSFENFDKEAIFLDEIAAFIESDSDSKRLKM